MNWSQSIIKAFSCPVRGRKIADRLERYGKETADPESPALVGSAMHDFAKRYFLHCMEAGLETDLYFADQLLHEVLNAYPGLGTLTPDFLSLADRFLNSTVVPMETFGVLIEETLEYRLAETFPVEGTPDLIIFHQDGVIEIVDYKTNRKIYSQAEAEQDLQLKLYAWLVLCKVQTENEDFDFEGSLFHLVYRFVRYSQDVDFYMTGEEIKQFGHGLAILVDAIHVEGAALPGKACRWCDFSVGCDAIRDHDISPIKTNSEARAELGKIVGLERGVALHKARLKEWADQHGPVTFSDGDDAGKTMNFVPEEWITYPANSIHRLLVGDDPNDPIFCDEDALWAEMELPKTRAAALIRNFVPGEDRQAIFEALAESATKHTITKFKAVKKNVEPKVE